MPPPPQLTRIDPEDPRWERFVRSHPGATVYHLPAWSQILGTSYGFSDASVALEAADGTLEGVFPLLARKRRLSGARLRSLPIVPGGGPLARTNVGRDELIAAAARAARSKGYALFFRSGAQGLQGEDSGVGAIDTPPLYVLDLPDDYDAWLRERPKRLVRGVKRARKDGVTVRLATTPEDLRAFYGMYLDTMRKHKAAPRRFDQLELAQRLLGDHFRLFVAEIDGRPIAGGVFHVFNGTVELLYNGSDRSALDHRPNHALYAHVIAWAREAGMDRLDFGAAWPGPLGEFKAQWGAVPVPEWVYTTGLEPGAYERAAPPLEGAEPPTGPRVRARKVVDDLWDRAPLPVTETASGFALRWL